MKIIIAFFCFLISVCLPSNIEYIDGQTYVNIVIKLKSGYLQALPTTSSTDQILDDIANSLNSKVISLEGITSPLPSVENNHTFIYEKELMKYRNIYLDANMTKDEIIDAITNIQQLNDVEEVYLEPKAEVAIVDINYTALPSVSSQTGSYTNLQGYLNPAPQGIDAKYAWTKLGGRGSGVHVIDVEFAWNKTHEDFPEFFIHLGYHYNSSLSARNHGTPVLGIIGAVDNGFGTIGISSDASIGASTVIHISSTGTYINYAQAIINASNVLGKGDVLIIELQQNGKPIEYYSQNYDAIRLAVSKGITVVAAAGNGGYNLDNLVFNHAFDRNYRDSGAIIVAASQSTDRTPTYYTCYGSRIDVHSWGWNIVSLGGQGEYAGNLFNGGNENRWYTKSFAGTSGATPIVAGAAASLQGVAKANIGRFLTPAEVRKILSSTATPQSGGYAKRIGGQPNLRKAINHLLYTTPSNPSGFWVSEIESTTALLRWRDNADNEIGYRVYRGSTLIATLPANTTSYRVTNLSPNKQYTFTLKPYNNAGESGGTSVRLKSDADISWLIPAIYYPMLLAP